VEKGETCLTATAVPGLHASDDATAALLMPVNGHLLDFSRGDQLLHRLYATCGTTRMVSWQSSRAISMKSSARTVASRAVRSRPRPGVDAFPIGRLPDHQDYVMMAHQAGRETGTTIGLESASASASECERESAVTRGRVMPEDFVMCRAFIQVGDILLATCADMVLLRHYSFGWRAWRAAS
jgi:hypothetical protein